MTEGLPPTIAEHVSRLESQDPGHIVAVFDKIGYYLYASANHSQTIGYSPEELTSLHLSKLVHPAEQHGAWVLRTISVFYSKPMHFSSRLITKSGELVGVSGTLQHLRGPEGEMYFVTCVKTL